MADLPRDVVKDSVLLRLRDVEGLDCKEIANRCGTTEEAVEQRFRAMDSPAVAIQRELASHTPGHAPEELIRRAHALGLRRRPIQRATGLSLEEIDRILGDQ